MPRILTQAALAALLIGAAAASGCQQQAPAPAPVAAPAPEPVAPPAAPPEPAAPAVTVDVTAVDLGNTAGEDNRVAAPMTTFAARDTLHAAVAVRPAAGAPTPATATLAARWTYQDGQLVDETSQEYAFDAETHVGFQVTNPDGWPLGRYKVEILRDGELAQTREFEVR